MLRARRPGSRVDFNPRTLIAFTLATRVPVVLAIYDVTGRRVRKLLDGSMEPALHEVVWDGAGKEGDRLGSGIYWVQLTTEGYRSSKQLIMLR